jgi:hypothetical protein
MLVAFLSFVTPIFNHISKVLTRHNIKTVGICSIPCECGKVCIDQTSCSIETRIKEHHWHIRLYHPDSHGQAQHRHGSQYPVSGHQDSGHENQMHGTHH